MRIVVTGSTGLIGTRLVSMLLDDGHQVVRLVRPSSSNTPTDASTSAPWEPSARQLDEQALAGADAVVHLAGVGIADSRWTDEQKARILSSRVQGTTLLAETMASMSTPPPVLLSGSAIGYYGDHGSRIIDEDAESGDDFPAEVCRQWEAAAAPAAQAGIRVSYLRTGVVQATEGGALAKQLPFFKFGLGGKVGSGDQFISWISLLDEVRAIRFLIDHAVPGPVNLTAPEPVTNSEYTKTLGSVLHRPTTILPITGPRLLYGRELADSLLLTSQRVVPAALLEAGFEFRNPDLRGALESVLS